MARREWLAVVLWNLLLVITLANDKLVHVKSSTKTEFQCQHQRRDMNWFSSQNLFTVRHSNLSTKFMLPKMNDLTVIFFIFFNTLLQGCNHFSKLQPQPVYFFGISLSDFIFGSNFESSSIYHHDQGLMIINHCGGSPENTGISSLSAAHSVNTSMQLQLSPWFVLKNMRKNLLLKLSFF